MLLFSVSFPDKVD